ncbi:MAG: GGDEF domain-containing protein [Gemmatimonadetes bacterium]|nr:GGDEF domain-containing protein [Gemmatimonadota bacterium]
MTPWLLPVLFALGGVAGWVARRWVRGNHGAASPGTPADPQHVLDLLRRAHGAAFACLVQADGEPVLTAGALTGVGDLAERVTATARVALGDRRQHVLRDPHTIVAVGDGDHGVALAWKGTALAPDAADAALADQRALLAAFRAGSARGWAPKPAVTGPPGATVPEALESVAFAVCEAARAASECPTAIVMRDPGSQAATIVAVSHGVDRRLIRSPVAPDSVAGRACMGDIPIVGMSGRELFGQLRADRRRREEQGGAFPLHDGRQGVGALVVFGRPDQLGGAAQQRLVSLAEENGPRLAMAAAIRAAETRAQTDELTGLWNRRALDRTLQSDQSAECALLLVDLDHFKKLNDNFGHAAGDAALRHVARVLRSTLREQDLAARVGGEEFALWLPNTPLERAREVAERVRQAVAEAKLYWAGAELSIACSVGLAGKPVTVGQTANLYAAADAALYRAKDNGRNRVEVALPSR